MLFSAWTARRPSHGNPGATSCSTCAFKPSIEFQFPQHGFVSIASSCGSTLRHEIYVQHCDGQRLTNGREKDPARNHSTNADSVSGYPILAPANPAFGAACNFVGPQSLRCGRLG